MTDIHGNLLWYAEYTAWCRLKKDERVYKDAHQPFRLQNQYFDEETGLHYNPIRYYEPNAGRFVNQELIGLWGGENLYAFAPNTQKQFDPLGLSNAPGACNNPCDNDSLDWTSHGGKHVPPKNSGLKSEKLQKMVNLQNINLKFIVNHQKEQLEQKELQFHHLEKTHIIKYMIPEKLLVHQKGQIQHTYELNALKE